MTSVRIAFATAAFGFIGRQHRAPNRASPRARNALHRSQLPVRSHIPVSLRAQSVECGRWANKTFSASRRAILKSSHNNGRLALAQFLGYVKNRPSGGERLRFARFLYVVAAGAALSGCVTTRYVTVHCIAKDQVLPSEPEKVGPKLTGRADEDLRTIAGSAVRLRSWGEGLNGILEGCRDRG